MLFHCLSTPLTQHGYVQCNIAYSIFYMDLEMRTTKVASIRTNICL